MCEKVVVVAQQVGGAVQQGDQVTVGDVGEQRQQLVADAVSSEPRVGVGRVGDGSQLEGDTQCVRVSTAERKDRVRGAGADGGEPARTASAEQSQQCGLGLVVGGVTEECIGPEEAVALVACSGLEVRSVVEIGVLDAECDVELCGDRSGSSGVVVG